MRRYTRRQLSSDLLAVSVILGGVPSLTGWNPLALYIVVAGWTVAAAGVLVLPTRQRALVAAGSAMLFLYYAGAVLLLGLGAYHLLTRDRGSDVRPGPSD